MESTSDVGDISVNQNGDSDMSRASVGDDSTDIDPHGKRKATHPLERVDYKRFRVTREEDLHKWSLPVELATYANEASEEFIPEKELKEQVLLEAPRPSNLDPIKVLDESLGNVLKKEHPQSLELDRMLKKVQERVADIMGPLSKVWMMVENVRTATEEEELPSPEEVAKTVEKTVTMVGQCLNVLTYERRRNVLSATSKISSVQAAATLKEKAPLLQQHDADLFGKKYREHMTELHKSMKQEVIVSGKPSNNRKWHKQPFLGGPSHSRKTGGGALQQLQSTDKAIL